jgi:hypothetical protein
LAITTFKETAITAVETTSIIRQQMKRYFEIANGLCKLEGWPNAKETRLAIGNERLSASSLARGEGCVIYCSSDSRTVHSTNLVLFCCGFEGIATCRCRHGTD